MDGNIGMCPRDNKMNRMRVRLFPKADSPPCNSEGILGCDITVTSLANYI